MCSSDLDDPVEFDLDADGVLNRTAWTARGSQIAFLALDRNGNGGIDDGRELFGTATMLQSGLLALNGFLALSEFDSNGDGVVDAVDAQWPSLLLWTDVNHDGLSQPEELRTVAASSIQGIGTEYRWTGRRDSHGNLFRYKGIAFFGHGRRPIYDVFFIGVP